MKEVPPERLRWWRLFLSRIPPWNEVPEVVKRRFFGKPPLLVGFAHRLAQIDGVLRDVGFPSTMRMSPALRPVVDSGPGFTRVLAEV
jgi:hypothetical protein